MANKIEDALVEATGLRKKRDEDFGKWAGRLVTAVQDLPEDEWDKLDAETQNWVNDASRAINKDKDPPRFPGDEEPEEEPEEEKPRGRRVRAKEPEPEEEPAEEPAEEEPEEEKPVRNRNRRRAEAEEEPAEEEKPARSRARRAAKEEEPEEEKPRSRSRRKDEEEDKPARGKPAKRGAEPEGKGVSATTIMKEMMIEDPATTTEEVLEHLAKEYDLHPTRMAMASLRSGFLHSMRVLAKAKKLDRALAAKL